MAPTATHGDPFTFFRPDVVLPPKDGITLERGVPVVAVLDTKGHELSVFTAIEVSATVTVDRTALTP